MAVQYRCNRSLERGEPSVMAPCTTSPRSLRACKNAFIWAWSFVSTSLQDPVKSPSGAVAHKIVRPLSWTSSIHNTPAKLARTHSPWAAILLCSCCPTTTRMDIAYRDLQVVILLQPAEHRLLRQAIAPHRMGDGVTHCPGIAPPRRHTGNGRLAILAAGTASLRHATFGDNPGTAMEGCNVSNASCQHALPFALRPALWTGIIRGLHRLVLKLIGLAAD